MALFNFLQGQTISAKSWYLTTLDQVPKHDIICLDIIQSLPHDNRALRANLDPHMKFLLIFSSLQVNSIISLCSHMKLITFYLK